MVVLEEHHDEASEMMPLQIASSLCQGLATSDLASEHGKLEVLLL